MAVCESVWVFVGDRLARAAESFYPFLQCPKDHVQSYCVRTDMPDERVRLEVLLEGLFHIYLVYEMLPGSSSSPHIFCLSCIALSLHFWQSAAAVGLSIRPWLPEQRNSMQYDDAECQLRGRLARVAKLRRAVWLAKFQVHKASRQTVRSSRAFLSCIR